MPIPNSRTRENARIIIDEAACNGCGICVEICKDQSLTMINRKAIPSGQPIFGCFGCGQCMAICPREAITIEGRTMSPADLFPLPDIGATADYSQLLSLMQRRRSIRDFKHQEVPATLIDHVVRAAETAPMGIPPSDVHVIILDSREKVNAFAFDFCRTLESMQFFTSDWFMALMRPFWSKESYRFYHDFVKPLMAKYIASGKDGKNYVTYDAPAALYFYGTSYSDTADPIIPATYAMLAAESLGLGTCMIGGVHPFTQKGRAAGRFRMKYNIRFKSKEGLILLMGYPKFRFRKGISRTFAEVFHPN